MTTGPLDLPTPGADASTWGTKLNTALNGTGPGTLSATYVQRSRTPIYAKDYGVVADGVADDTAALQAAIDAAQAEVSTDTNKVASARTVVLPPGQIRLTGQITAKTASIVGSSTPGIGTRIVWDGAADATVIRKDPTGAFRGGASNWELAYLGFKASGTNYPATWLDIPAGYAGAFGTVAADKFLHLHHLTFNQTSGDQIKCGYWVNLHWEHLRFDAPGGFAIRLTTTATQALSSFVLANFTYDHRASGEGLLLVDNSAGASNFGDLKLANARIENNTPWTGRKGVVVIQGATSYACTTHLDNITYQDGGVGTSGDCLVYFDGGGTAFFCPILLTNVRISGLSTILGGNLPTTLPTVPTGQYVFASIDAEGAVLMPSDSTKTRVGVEVRGSGTSGTYPFTVWRQNEAFPRVRVRNNGTIEIGDGTAAPDVAFLRTAANQLDMAAGDSFKTDGTWNGGHLVLGTRHLWVDATGLVRVKNGAPTTDTDGTVVGAQA